MTQNPNTSIILSPRRLPPNAFLAGYFWLILKNVIGWLLILAASPIGLAFPGPVGLPIFVIGFAMVTFPGKRRLTARVLRGRPLVLHGRWFTATLSCLSLIVPAVLLLILTSQADWDSEPAYVGPLLLTGLCILAAATTWVVTVLGFHALNFGLRFMPTVRRRTRPWLKRHGLDILPPRRGRRGQAEEGQEEILEVHKRHHDRLATAWALTKAWGYQAGRVGIPLLIFIWMIKPIVKDWDLITPYIHKTNLWMFLLASVIFSSFLFLRAAAWRVIIAGFGYRLPLAPAVRIWISSELARYIPGSLFQFMGRVRLAKPYGIPRAVTVTSQILELSAFLLGNTIVAVGCLLFHAAKIEGRALGWFVLALALLPTLSLGLHPRIFYGAVNRLRRWRGKEPIVTRLKGRVLIMLLLGSIVALIWQSLAIWLLTHDALHLKWEHWWYVAGAYCLAWIAGFLSFLSPGGLGVREVVLYLTLRAILPSHIKDQFGANRETLNAYLRFLPLLLRLWTIVGELMLYAAAWIADFPGAMNRADAPGRPLPDAETTADSPTPPVMQTSDA